MSQLLQYISYRIRASNEQDTTIKRELAWAHSKKVRRQHCPASTPVDATWPQRKRTTKEKRSGEGDVDSRTQVQLEEDGAGSTEQCWRWRKVVCKANGPTGVTKVYFSHTDRTGHTPGAVEERLSDFARCNRNRSIEPCSRSALFAVRLKPIVTANQQWIN